MDLRRHMASRGSVCVGHCPHVSPERGDRGMGVKAQEVKLQRGLWSETDTEPGYNALFSCLICI